MRTGILTRQLPVFGRSGILPGMYGIQRASWGEERGVPRESVRDLGVFSGDAGDIFVESLDHPDALAERQLLRALRRARVFWRRGHPERSLKQFTREDLFVSIMTSFYRSIKGRDWDVAADYAVLAQDLYESMGPEQRSKHARAMAAVSMLPFLTNSGGSLILADW